MWMLCFCIWSFNWLGLYVGGWCEVGVDIWISPLFHKLWCKCAPRVGQGGEINEAAILFVFFFFAKYWMSATCQVLFWVWGTSPWGQWPYPRSDSDWCQMLEDMGLPGVTGRSGHFQLFGGCYQKVALYLGPKTWLGFGDRWGKRPFT